MNHEIRKATASTGFVLFAALGLLQISTGAQDRLKSMPGYDRYEKIGRQIPGSVKGGVLAGTWTEKGTFEYTRDGKVYRFDVSTGKAVEAGPPSEPEPIDPGRGPGGMPRPVERGRQATSAESPDHKLTALYRDRNLWLADSSGAEERAITTDGSAKERIKYGTASWVYGEELDQTTAMWWSPDSRKLAYYRFDETHVPDYYVPIKQTQLQSGVDTEAYPRAGSPNPVVDLLVYDVVTRKTTKVDVRSGKPFDDSVVGHYVYHVQWSPDGRELLFNRTNRRQNVLDLVAANPETGAARVVVRDEWRTGWVENNPETHFLKDGRRFIRASERTGWNNFYLYDLSGTLIAPLTKHATFEAVSVVKVDEQANALFYTARDGDNLLKLQLHRVGLDGRNDIRLTDPAYHHTIAACTGVRRSRRFSGAANCGVSPDSRYFADVYQAHDVPPATRIVDAGSGKTVAELARSDTSKFSQLGLKKAEMFTFTAADGRTALRGLIQFPSDFDPSRTYPALVSVYGGPAWAGDAARETFVLPSPLTEYGFLVINLDSRATPGLGKRTLDSIYLKLGQAEVDDLAEGVKALWSRPYVDRTRVGIYGTSYGGYASLMALLRYPDVFAAASASSPVTAWYHYDSIYTERYMWLPGENKANYDAGSAMTYVSNLKGRLMLYYGTADNNVHPSNTMQLVAALQQAGKSFELQAGPDRGHSGLNTDRMMEFFIENLQVRSPAPAGSQM